MSNHLKYFAYIIEHKFNVFLEACFVGEFIYAFTHDLSKFLPSEFFGYSNKFYGNKFIRKDRIKDDYEMAWLLHQHRNKHHWNYWVGSDGVALPMPKKYIVQMVIDWRAMARKFNDTAPSYYKLHKDEMILHQETRKLTETYLICNMF